MRQYNLDVVVGPSLPNTSSSRRSLSKSRRHHPHQEPPAPFSPVSIKDKHVVVRTQTTSRTTKQLKWLVAGVCLFVTMHFCSTLCMFWILSRNEHHRPLEEQVTDLDPPLSIVMETRKSIDAVVAAADASIGVTSSSGDFVVAFQHQQQQHALLKTTTLRGTIRPSRLAENSHDHDDATFRIVFSRQSWTADSIRMPPPLLVSEESSIPNKMPAKRYTSETNQADDENNDSTVYLPHSPNYGGLKFVLGLPPGIARNIQDGMDKPKRNSKNQELQQQQQQDEDVDEYYAFDDDAIRAKATASLDEGRAQVLDNEHCRRTHSHRLHFPTCNEIHQMDPPRHTLENHVRYLNHGSFRQVFSLEQQPNEMVAWKEIRYDEVDDMLENLEYVHMDAIVAERLTASPRIYDIYGYCGLSIVSEYFQHGDLEQMAMPSEHTHIRPQDLNDKEQVKPQNELEPAQKLVLALEMAEGLADLHGFADGLIIHDDVQLSQFLLSSASSNNDDSPTFRLKLNDFNRAEFVLWDDVHQHYCPYQNGRGRGTWRSPEEYKDWPLTEAIDVWSFGNNLYGMLTGLDPFYELDSKGKQRKKARQSVAMGETAFVDPRYARHTPEEKVLVKLIKRCFEYEPEDRPTMFEIVAELRKAVEELIENKEGRGVSRYSILRSIVDQRKKKHQ